MFIVSGDFDTTDLAQSTITLIGSNGDDTVDLTTRASNHHIVFHTKGGNDMLFGPLLDTDVIHLAPGTTISDYNVTDDGTTKTLSNGVHSITYSSGSNPIIEDSS